MVEFDFATLEHRLRELAFLNSGVTILLSDMRHAVEKREEMRYDGGIEAFVKYLDRNKTSVMPAPIVIGPSTTASAWKRRCGGTTATTRTCCASPTTFRSVTAAPISPASAAR